MSKQTIGEKLKSLRVARGLSQLQLSVGICTASAISQIETNRMTPSSELLTKLAAKLDVDVSYLGTDSDLRTDVLVIEGYIAKEDFEAALNHIETAQKKTCIDPSLAHDLKLWKGMALSRLDQGDEALDVLMGLDNQANYLTSTKWAKLLNELGNACFRMYRFNLAYSYYVRAYQKSIELDRDDFFVGTISYNLANTCRWLGLFDQALMYIKAAQELYSNLVNHTKFADALLTKGITLQKLGRSSEAELCIQQAVVLYDTERNMQKASEARHAYNYLIMLSAEPKVAIEKLTGSVAEFERAGNLEAVVYTYVIIADWYLDHGSVDQAEEYLSKALAYNLTSEDDALSPQLLQLDLVRAKISGIQGQYDLAVSLGGRAAKGLESLGLVFYAVDAYKFVKRILEQQGKYKDAIEVSDKVIDLMEKRVAG